MTRYFRPTALSQRNDPSEPHLAHENNNCTCTATAEAVRAATNNAKTPRGGDIRHKQSDQVGGTDLLDVKTAAAKYGVTLTLGYGWAEMKQRRAEGRFLIIQGDSGDLDGACSEGQDVAHAIGVHPDDGASGYWLIQDPWCYVKGSKGIGKWRWIDRDDVYAYAKKLGFRFAYTKRLTKIA
jgi:hypothetical protein